MRLDGDELTAKAVDAVLRAYAPYQRGQDVSRDVPALLAILAVYSLAEAGDGHVAECWQRALAHASRAGWSFGELSRAMRSLEGVLPRSVVSAVTRRTERDMPWVGAVVSAVENSRLSRREIGAVFDGLLERLVRDGWAQFGEFYTPASVSMLAATIAAPARGESVLDPACGHGAFVTAAARLSTGSKPSGANFQARSLNQSSGDLAALSFVVHDVEVDLHEPGGVTHMLSETEQPRFDIVLSNPPFNQPFLAHSPARARPFGDPPKSSANFAWLQLGLTSLTRAGRAVMLMPPIAGATEVAQEAEIRRRMVDNDVIAGVIALPPRLFPGTGIAPHMWIMMSDKQVSCPGRSGEVLFIDAHRLGVAVGRTQTALTETDLEKIADCYQAWATRAAADYEDVPGFCRSVGLNEIARHGYRLTPSAFVGSPPSEQAPDAPSTEHILEQLERIEAESRRVRTKLRTAMEIAQANPVRPPSYRRLGEILDAGAQESLAGILPGPSGSILRAADYSDAGEVPVIMPRDIGDNRFNLDQIARVTEEKARQLDRFRLLPGDIVIARRGELGRRSLVRDENAGWLCGTGCMRIRPGNSIDPQYLAAYLGRPEVRDWLSRHASVTTTLPNYTAATLMKLPVLLPTVQSQADVAAVAELIAEHWQLTHEAEEALAVLRHAAFSDLLAVDLLLDV